MSARDGAELGLGISARGLGIGETRLHRQRGRITVRHRYGVVIGAPQDCRPGI